MIELQDSFTVVTNGAADLVVVVNAPNIFSFLVFAGCDNHRAAAYGVSSGKLQNVFQVTR
jgi:hypothetical protein